MARDKGPHPVSDGRKWQGDRRQAVRFSIRCAIRAARPGRSHTDLGILAACLLLCSLLTATLPSRVSGLTSGPIRPSTRQSDNEKEFQALEPGRPINRELAGGQRHYYRITLSADQFAKVIVEQQGIDLEILASGPDGKQIAKFDSENRPSGQESVPLVVEVAGDYRLQIQPIQQGVPAGSYQIRIEELRPATENDRALDQARRLYLEARRAQNDGKYDEALSSARKALEIRESILGADHSDVIYAVNNLGTIFRNKGEYAQAEPLYQRALSACERTVGPEHPLTAGVLNGLANLYREKGEYAKAESGYQRVLEIREKALGPEHFETGAALNNLALINWNRGEYAKAEPLYLRCLAIWQQAVGPEHPAVSTVLGNLANLYYERSEYAKAEPLYLQALAIDEKTMGPQHPDVAYSLLGLAILNRKRGEYQKAESFYQRALEIWEKALGPQHPEVAAPLQGLGILYTDLGDETRAEPLFQRALDIQEKTLGARHPEVAMLLGNLARLYLQRGETAKAAQFYQRALDIQEQALGPEHPDVALSLDSLAGLYRRKAQYAQAERFYRRALEIREKALGPHHPDVADTLNHLAILYTARGARTQAARIQARADAINERNLTLNLAIGSERQRLAYLATLSHQTDETISLHLRSSPDHPLARRLALTVILQRKARALDVTSENLNALRGRFNSEDRALLDRLTATRSRLARLILSGPQKMAPAQYRDQIRDLENQVESDEANISRSSAEFRAQSLPVTLESVQAAIPPEMALIEFVSYRPFNAKAARDDDAYGPPRYVAYVLRHRGAIQWTELGAAKIIDREIVALRQALRDPKRGDVERLAHSVERRIFQPIRRLVGTSGGLLISPDGALNLIPFAALVDDRGRYLVGRYSISYLTSGRDLLSLQVPRTSQSGPLVVANPDFGESDHPLAQIAAPRQLIQRPEPPKTQGKEQSAVDLFSQFYFPPLPYTAEEGEALRLLLPDATVLTERRATKIALQQVRGPTLLHVATHGFFLDDLKLADSGGRGGRGDRSLDTDPTRLLVQLEKNGIRVESPLLRSGLALAGANEHQPDDNGVLTALEVTGLNLWGTKLVTLSACDTGVGEVRNGDGVHGLRRALVLAGSETQVMSLWAVSDQATRELMVAYYGRLKRGQGRGEALRRVQLEMLKDARRRHPYYWASFIQSGEWANLDGAR